MHKSVLQYIITAKHLRAGACGAQQSYAGLHIVGGPAAAASSSSKCPVLIATLLHLTFDIAGKAAEEAVNTFYYLT